MFQNAILVMDKIITNNFDKQTTSKKVNKKHAVELLMKHRFIN